MPLLQPARARPCTDGKKELFWLLNTNKQNSGELAPTMGQISQWHVRCAPPATRIPVSSERAESSSPIDAHWSTD